MAKLQDKIHIVNHQKSKLFTTIGRLYINTMSMRRGDRFNVPSDMSFLASQINFLAETT